jgi:uncharacterized membrane protein YagU involved in acid resistance
MPLPDPILIGLKKEPPMQSKDRETINAILLGGLIAGAIDIGAASLISGRSLGYIMQVIAGGLLGKTSFAGGAGTMLLGFVLQELMGVLIACAYVMLARGVPVLARRWLISGLGYGVLVFFVMNYVVLPLSAWKSIPHFTALKFSENMAAMLLFGLIVAFFARRLRGSTVSDHKHAASAPA